MSRLVDMHFAPLNGLYDSLPVQAKLAVIRGRFDAWVRAGGVLECIACSNKLTRPAWCCDECGKGER